ncbi:MAG: hypothetical protein JWR69_462 [Pedosphaera sp.]|nr:hypothetical protein [Pedosphaera sp.]
MTKKIWSLIALISLAPSLARALPTFEWTRQATSTGVVMGGGIAVDTNGNIFVTGSFTGTADFGGTNLVSTGASDIFLAKYDTLGNLLWAQQAGGTNNDGASGIAVDASGNVFVTGSFIQAATFQGTNLLSRGTSGYSDMFLAKYDNSGTLLWVQGGGTNVAMYANGLAVDAGGNCFVAGRFIQSTYFGTNWAHTGGSSPFVAKYDPAGNILWGQYGRAAGYSVEGEADGVAVDPSGNVAITGFFDARILFGTNQLVAGGAPELFVVKYAADGTLLWAQAGKGTKSDSGTGIASDGSGNFCVTGFFQRAASFGNFTLVPYLTLHPPNTDGGTPFPDSAYQDGFVAKYGPAGNVMWAQIAADTDTGSGFGITVSQGGDAVLTGSGRNRFLLGTNSITTDSSLGIYSMLFDGAGSPTWLRTAGGPQNDVGQAVAADANGNIYLTGFFSGSGTFGTTNLTGTATNLFVTKLAALDPGSPPIISTQPTNTVVLVSSNTLFNVGVLSALPVTYQWQYNGTNLAQPNSPMLSFTNALPPIAGNYSVIISNANGAVTSQVVRLEVEVPPDFVWAKKAGGSVVEGTRSVALDDQGNSYVAGSFQQGSISFGGIVLTNNGWRANFPSLGSNDVFIAKYDPAGNPLWAQSAGGTNSDEATALAVDGSGNVYVTGYFQRTATFGNITLTNTTGPSTNYIFLAKYDSGGNLLWVQQAGGQFSDQGRGLALDASGNIFLTGSIYGTATFGNTNLVPPSNRLSAFLAKYDASGNLLWVTSTQPSPASVDAYAVAVDDAGNPVIAGSFTGTLTLGTNTLSATNPVAAVFTAKYDGAGNVLWASQSKQDSSAYAGTVGTGIAVDHAGNVFVTGNFKQQIKFGTLSYGDTFVNFYPSVFLVKYDSLGNPVWLRGAFAQNHNPIYSYAAALDGFGNPYIAGTNSPYLLSGNSPGKTNLTTQGGFVAKFSNGGDFLWAREGVGLAAVSGLAVNQTNEVLLAGRHVSSTTFGGTTLSSVGGNLFLAKLGINPPGLSAQPTNRSAIVGATVTLSVGTTGTPPLSYQWQFNGTPIDGATASTLTLTNVHSLNAGSYTVVITNPSGTITTSGAVLTVIPMVNPPAFDGTNLILTWPDTVTLQTSTNGVAGPYFDVPGAASPYTNLLTSPQQFFRLRN